MDDPLYQRRGPVWRDSAGSRMITAATKGAAHAIDPFTNRRFGLFRL
jgi:hypothetical protein